MIRRFLVVIKIFHGNIRPNISFHSLDYVKTSVIQQKDKNNGIVYINSAVGCVSRHVVSRKLVN